MTSATTASAMTPLQTIGIFVAVPLLICLVIALAVYVPVWRRRRRHTGTFRDRTADTPLTSGVLLNDRADAADDEGPR